VQAGGRRRHISRSGFATQKDAKAALAVAEVQWGRGDRRPLVRPSEQPVGDFLREWVDSYRGRKGKGLKEATRDSYRRVVEHWLAPRDRTTGEYADPPFLGLVRLRDLGAAQLDALYAHLRCVPPTRAQQLKMFSETGRRPPTRRPKALSESSVAYTHTVLTMALGSAVTAGKLATSPAELLPVEKRPAASREDRPTMTTWSTDEVRSFLASVTDPMFHALYSVALDTGARRGELLGLKWADVDLDQATVSIVRNRTPVAGRVVTTTPKSGRGRQPALSAGTVAELRRWRRLHQAEQRLLAADAWQAGDWVFTTGLGEPLNPEAVTAAFGRHQRDLGLPKLRFHDLRHTSATLALQAKVPAKVVQERLGHSSIQITVDLYQHVTPGMDAAAAELLGRAIYGPSSPRAGRCWQIEGVQARD
jgi:integrase